MEIIARLIELKPNSTKKVDAWTEHINSHRKDAIASIQAEGVSIESWFSFSLEDKEYLLCYMRVESITQSRKVAASSENPIDAFHQQFKVDTWVRGSGAIGKLLVDLPADAG